MKYFDLLVDKTIHEGDNRLEVINKEYQKVESETENYISRLEDMADDLLRFYTRDIQSKLIPKEEIALGHGIANYVYKLNIEKEQKTEIYEELNLKQQEGILLADKLWERTKYLQLLEADMKKVVTYLNLPLYLEEFKKLEEELKENRVRKVLFTYGDLDEEVVKKLMKLDLLDIPGLLNTNTLLKLEQEIYQ